jgi:hypothetical protein
MQTALHLTGFLIHVNSVLARLVDFILVLIT